MSPGALRTALGLAVVCMCVPAASAAPKKPAVFAHVDQDISDPATEAELLALAATLKSQAHALLRGKSMIDVDRQLVRLDDPDPAKRLAIARDLSGGAMLLMAVAQQKDVVTVLCTAPVAVAPTDRIVVNNFSAFLRMVESRDALAVSLYANALFPDAPAVLTNLGNTLFELGDDRKAETFFRKALKVDPRFRDARTGLIHVYLKRRDFGAAYAELLKGVEEITFSENTASQFSAAAAGAEREAKANPEKPRPTPPPPASPPPSPGRAGRTPDRLELPPFPDWSNLQAFLAAKGPGQWEREVAKGMSAEVSAIQDAATRKSDRVQAITKLPTDDQFAAMEALHAAPWARLAERNEFATRVMEQGIEDRLAKIDREYADADDAIGAKFNERFEALNAAFATRSDALATSMEAAGPLGLAGIPAYQALLVDWCKQSNLLAENWFQEWKKIARVHHQKVSDLLHEYWIYCEPYLDRVFGEDYEALSHQRVFFVYTKLSAVADEYPIRQLGFAAVGGGGANGAGDCGTVAPRPPAGSDDMPMKVPATKGPPCPFPKNTKAKCGIGPASVALDCESIEFEVLEGIGAAAKWNFKTKELTVVPEIGVKGNVGTGEFSVKQGVAVTFDRNGTVTDLAWVMEGGASMNLGGTGITPGATTTLTYSAVTGIKTDYGLELGISP